MTFLNDHIKDRHFANTLYCIESRRKYNMLSFKHVFFDIEKNQTENAGPFFQDFGPDKCRNICDSIKNPANASQFEIK